MARILVADDEPDIFLVVRITLQSAGHTVFGAPTGEDAIDILAREPIDLMLLDIRLPGLDGWDILQRVRADSALQGLKVIMMSAHSSPGTKVRASDLGSDAYLTKPFSLVELTDLVASTIAG